MIRDVDSPWITSRLFVYVFLLITGVACGIIELPDSCSEKLVSEGFPNSLPKIENAHSGPYVNNKTIYNYALNITNIKTVEDDDPDYPHEQILQLVNETRTLLLSSNITEKNEKLKFDPSLYESYLKGENPYSTLNFPINEVPSSAGPASLGYVCQEEVLNRLPKRLKTFDGEEHYIVNVGRAFTQSFRTIRCRNPRRACSDPSTWPEYYSYMCDENLGRRVRLFSVPVNRRFSISEQGMHDFQVPNGCNCRVVRTGK